MSKTTATMDRAARAVADDPGRTAYAYGLEWGCNWARVYTAFSRAERRGLILAARTPKGTTVYFPAAESGGETK